MIHRSPRQARLIAEIPIERVDLTSGDRSSLPAIGDIVDLDQGFTGPNGEPMGTIYCVNSDGSVRWAADAFDSELELVNQHGNSEA
jgi:hypothetical protein